MPRMLEYGFEEGKDFVTFCWNRRQTIQRIILNIRYGSETQWSNAQKKDKARTYFIKREKIAKEANRVMSPAEQLWQMLNSSRY
jgi:phage anti-repressor protein